jgi:hypothetical protein
MNKILLALLFILPIGAVTAFPTNMGSGMNQGMLISYRNNTNFTSNLTNGTMMNSEMDRFNLTSQERERMSNMVNNRLQNALEKLQSIEARLEKEGIPTTGLNESISNIMQIEQNLNNSIQNGNLTEIRNYTNQMYHEFSDIRDSVNNEVLTYEQNKIRDTVEVAGGLMDRIQTILSQMKSDGMNVTALQSEFTQIQLQLNETNSTVTSGNGPGEYVSEAARLMFRFRDMLSHFRDDMIRVVNHEPPMHWNMEAETHQPENVSAQENSSVQENETANQTNSGLNATANESVSENNTGNETG